MKHLSIQQEILLMTDSSVAHKEFCPMEDRNGARHLTAAEQLEQACWNGMLGDIIPEVLKTTASGKPLFLWQIQEAKHFLHIVLCEEPVMGHYDESIDPYIFLLFVQYN